MGVLNRGQNYHELNRMAFKPRSPGSCFHLPPRRSKSPAACTMHNALGCIAHCALVSGGGSGSSLGVFKGQFSYQVFIFISCFRFFLCFSMGNTHMSGEWGLEGKVRRQRWQRILWVCICQEI